jgi:RNase P subunit RPR2
MDITVQREGSLTEAKELACKARDEMIETGNVTVVCPKCGTIPKVNIDGVFHERIMVKCKCGYIKTIELGI